MQSIEPKSLRIPETQKRYVLKTIDSHINTVNKDILQLKEDNQSQFEADDSSNNHHLNTLPNKSKLLLSSINKKKGLNRPYRNIQSPTYRYKSSEHRGNLLPPITEPRLAMKPPKQLIRNKQDSDINQSSPGIKLNQHHCLSELNKIDAATLHSLRNFIISNEEVNQAHENLKKKLGRVIQRENRLFKIASDEYLYYNKNEYDFKRSDDYQNLDYILSKLNNADYYNINQKINQNTNIREKMRLKEINMMENKRHEKVQMLFDKIDKKM